MRPGVGRGYLLCGNGAEPVPTEQLRPMMERLRQLCEIVVFAPCGNKALGLSLRLLAARALNGDASLAQLAAVAGVSKSGAAAAITRLRVMLPACYSALWPSPRSRYFQGG